MHHIAQRVSSVFCKVALAGTISVSMKEMEANMTLRELRGTDWTCNGFVPVTYLIMPPWLRMRAG
jgi:hypothetical protein